MSRQVNHSLRVLHLAAHADLLRPDRGGPEQLRPQLLLLRLRSRLPPRALLAPHVADAPPADARLLPRLPPRVRRQLRAGPPPQHPRLPQPAPLQPPPGLVAIGPPLRGPLAACRG